MPRASGPSPWHPSFARKARTASTKAPTPSSKRHVLATCPNAASTRAVAATGAVALPVSDRRSRVIALVGPAALRAVKEGARLGVSCRLPEFSSSDLPIRDEVGQRDLADRRPPLSHPGSRSGDGAAVAGGDTLAVDFLTTPSRRAGRTTITSAPARARRVASCGSSSGPRRTAAGVAQRLPRSRRPPCRCCSNPAGEAPARTGFFSGLSRCPARPIAFAVVATMRTGFEVGPRVGRQERMYRRRRRWAEASRRSSPPPSVCTGAHDRPR